MRYEKGLNLIFSAAKDKFGGFCFEIPDTETPTLPEDICVDGVANDGSNRGSKVPGCTSVIHFELYVSSIFMDWTWLNTTNFYINYPPERFCNKLKFKQGIRQAPRFWWTNLPPFATLILAWRNLPWWSVRRTGRWWRKAGTTKPNWCPWSKVQM